MAVFSNSLFKKAQVRVGKIVRFEVVLYVIEEILAAFDVKFQVFLRLVNLSQLYTEVNRDWLMFTLEVGDLLVCP